MTMVMFCPGILPELALKLLMMTSELVGCEQTILLEDMLVPDMVAHFDEGKDVPTDEGNDILIRPLLSRASVVFTTKV